MKENFLSDIQRIYDYVKLKKSKVNQLYEYLENKEYDKLELIENFASHLGLSIDEDLRVALVVRLVNLRDDALVQVLKKKDYKEKEIEDFIEKSYCFVRDYWHAYHLDTVTFINDNDLLNPFYRHIFESVYKIGIEMSLWQSSWTKAIINGTNKELLKKFKTDEKVMEYLKLNNFFDKGHEGLEADRCYSLLIKNGDKYTSKSYIEVFKKEVSAVINALEDMSDKILELEDPIYNQKWQYYKYIQALIKAFGETRVDMLVFYWAEVDGAWMEITTPIQIGHPLEYYEDHYRKAVALEWDIRLVNPKYQKENVRANKLKKMAETIYNEIDNKKQYKSIQDFAMDSLQKVQLYIGRPGMFFGAELNGLFSAQVVPNDEKVSSEFGKKIFAFSDEVLQSTRAKPFYVLASEIFPKNFLDKERTFLFNETLSWHKIYDITTIGHEFGHILWCDETTESVMNETGNFKNIEEFKATTGGLVSFFLDDSDEKKLEEYVIQDIVKRAVGLIAWMEVDEVQAYYCEGLIHLNGLFSSGIIIFDGTKILIDMHEQKVQALKNWYINIYISLAQHYLEKKDAGLWLNQFATKQDKYFMPNDESIRKFVEYYFKRYKEVGTKIDLNVTKKEYVA